MKRVVAFGLCLLLFSVFTGDNGLPALLRARRDARALAAEISAIRAENARLTVRAEALRSDPPTIEAVARETLGLARADELVVIRANPAVHSPWPSGMCEDLINGPARSRE